VRSVGLLSRQQMSRMLTAVLNELARSMGQPDFYPFVMCCQAALHLPGGKRRKGLRGREIAPGAIRVMDCRSDAQRQELL